MVRQSKLLLPLSLAILLAAAAWVPRAEAEATVSFGVFFDGLAPYGTWADHPRLGLVWSPDDVAVGWRPYSDGRWVFAVDEGWTFIGDEPWAWAPYHYGNWYFDPVLGWLWVPGYEWQPAVVDFVTADDWIGWAPRPPRAPWIAGWRPLPVHYTFVERRFFAEPLLPRFVVPVTRNLELVRIVEPVRVIDVEWVEQVVVTPIQRLRVRDVPTPRAVRAGWSKGEVRLFRPQIDRRAGLGPPPGRKIAKLESLHRVARQAGIERGMDRDRRELRAARRARDRVVVEPHGSGRTRARMAGGERDRRVKIERSAPRRLRETRAERRGRDLVDQRDRGKGKSRIDAGKIERRSSIKRSPPRRLRETTRVDRERRDRDIVKQRGGGSGGGGRSFDRAPQRQHAARGGGGGRGGGGKKGGGKP